jgi:DNA-3-methyladenine glycosylase
MKLEKDFFLSQDVVEIAKNLLGKYLFVKIDGIVCGGIITETEAYKGATDKASHAYQNKRTNRTEVMFLEGGRTYVYLCYGIHSLLNFVCSEENNPNAVLIRAIRPTHGLDAIRNRTGHKILKQQNFNGPGKLTRALGINRDHNNLLLDGDGIWLEDRGEEIMDKDIIVGPRIGIDYAEEDVLLPYRFLIKQKKDLI